VRRLRLLILPALLVLLVAACGDDGDDDDVATSGDTEQTTSTTAAASSTTTSTAAEQAAVIWPSADEVPGTTPEEVAVAFAETYLGIAGATAGTATADGTTTTVPVTKGPQGATTTVELIETETGWGVTGATAETIVVDAPATGAEVVSPLAVTGQANAFEGTVAVQVRPAGATDILGESFVTGAQGELAPFEGEVVFTGATPGETGAVVFYAPDESGEGVAITATVVAVTFTV
jgi:hypothetical protein